MSKTNYSHEGFRTLDDLFFAVHEVWGFGFAIGDKHYYLSHTVSNEVPRPSNMWFFGVETNSDRLELYNDVEYPTVYDAVHAKIFDGKSVVDLFETLDFSDN